jgi:hypothetical protein
LIREKLTRERAETLALEALAFLAGNPEALGRFLGSSGIEASELRRRASDPDMLRAIIEFLLADDALAGDFCRDRGMDPRDLHKANHVLGQP